MRCLPGPDPQERVVEQVGDEAEPGLGDDVDDLRVGVACSANGLDIGDFNMAARRRDLMGELRRRVGVRVGGMTGAVHFHVFTGHPFTVGAISGA